MAVALIITVLVATIAEYTCEPANGFTNKVYNNGNGGAHYDDLLKPPPPPLLPVIPVPFHGGNQHGISQRQNFDNGYHYQPPPQAPPPSPAPISGEFKFPAPFYKQYNFNFVPPPQPFTTTPSPSMFQKFSNWLFPQNSYDQQSEVISNYNAATFKKDCNPCNNVPWIPVIRYDLAPKNLRQNNNNNALPTYGPPSPTASKHIFDAVQNVPQPFSNQHLELNGNQQSNNHFQNYGPPKISQVVSTYGPPSPTHVVDISQSHPLSSPYAVTSNPISNFPYNFHTTTLKPIFNHPASYALSSSTFGLPASTISTPFAQYDSNFLTTTASPIITRPPVQFNQHFPQSNDVEVFGQNIPSQELQLPKVTRPTGFRNSYGEPIDNTFALNIPYSATATGAESSKVKTEVLPDNALQSHLDNMSLALANPAPFTLNRGRNIHTLQPVALPNLSISPLPPIFNARPFRPTPPKYFGNILYGSNQKQSDSQVNIAQSVPLAEYTHSIEYPTTFIQSPVIDIDRFKNSENQTKVYRNIQNSYVIDESRDIFPQASDHHVSAAKTNPDSSFESVDIGNELYDESIQSKGSLNKNIPPNHKPDFADLRGVKDEDVDKYRTESNLQNIDSPLLYLKPSAPHKNYENFFSSPSTPGRDKEFEIYDDTPITTPRSTMSTANILDSSKTYFMEESSIPTGQHSINHAKVVQIIVPYTINDKDYSEESFYNQQEFQARKVHTEKNVNYVTVPTETYSTIRTTTEEPVSTITDQYNSELMNTPAILNDFYDVKEPPFDIVKLQHTIDDWTQQEYSSTKEAQRVRSNEKYAKQIPDNYFTTAAPTTIYVTEENNYNNYDSYDHEFSSSNQFEITDNNTQVFSKISKSYNSVEKTKTNYDTAKNDEEDETLHIYTPSSTFRTTTTTSAPWGGIQTSISPLTNEKVYVVTSKPWREKQSVFNKTKEFNKFESQKTSSHSHIISSSEEVVIKPPKSFRRPLGGSYHKNGFRLGDGRLNSTKFDSSYTYSNGWHRRINNLGDDAQNEYFEELEDVAVSQERKTNKTHTTIDNNENNN
ncbi:uncharacterized protein LOC121728983 [Aricia agestis]|uniref:uncharacterized protein LOC121728983 n=1 Tax=Aricia agestis TaxID=91739 RepID=UPI001C20688F|nr:uncharacterized protein LOC121728983 [Aricia agestis]